MSRPHHAPVGRKTGGINRPAVRVRCLACRRDYRIAPTQPVTIPCPHCGHDRTGTVRPGR